MSRYELSIDTNYISSWGIVEGVRELFQNAIDQETENSNKKMSFSYDEISGTLTISNQNSHLNPETLLLGVTSKDGIKGMIGQHGEGYKLAILCLIRAGKKVTIHQKNEQWNPKFINSRKFNRKILVFDTVSVKRNDESLSFVVEGLTKEDWSNIGLSNLYIQGCNDIIKTDKGDILLEEKFKGKVFVNGLFVCEFPYYKYGYNIKPEYIEIDRDRKLVSDFALKWLASQMWASSNSELVLELIEQDVVDIAYLREQGHILDKELCNKAFDMFINEYGNNAIPVTTQEEFEKVKKLYKKCKPIYVGGSYSYMINNSDKVANSNYNYLNKKDEDKSVVVDELWSWWESVRDLLSIKDQNKFVELFEKLKEIVKEKNAKRNQKS